MLPVRVLRAAAVAALAALSLELTAPSIRIEPWLEKGAPSVNVPSVTSSVSVRVSGSKPGLRPALASPLAALRAPRKLVRANWGATSSRGISGWNTSAYDFQVMSDVLPAPLATVTVRKSMNRAGVPSPA